MAVAEHTSERLGTTPRPRLRWWVELLFALTFFGIYSAIRNRFGSAAVAPEEALANAYRVIDIERALGLFHEEALQHAFLGWAPFIRFWNVYYGTFHFVVTIFVLLWLFRRFPLRYEKWRNVLASTTGLALVGFSVFPLMPPRLLADCTSPYGGCEGGFRFVDTLAHMGGLWSFDSGAMQSLSNQYAAMPSVHIAWALWCCVAMFPTVRSWWARALLVAYPWLTLFAILVTANHFWLDAVGGIWVLGLGYLLGSLITVAAHCWRTARTGRGEQHQPEATPEARVDWTLVPATDGNGPADVTSATRPAPTRYPADMVPADTRTTRTRQ